MPPSTCRAEYRILGPLDVRVSENAVPLGRGREQRIIAALLLSVGRVVSVNGLIDAVWDGEPPTAAVKVIRNGVSALRTRFADSTGAVIVGHPSGYVLDIGDGYLDAADFAARATRARSYADDGRLAHSVGEARAALALWRGPALAGLTGQTVEAAASGLDEERLRLLEECLTCELALGGGPELVAELAQLVAEQPLRERFRALLMQALYRSGRRAEALDSYREGRRILVEQLGMEPGPELRELEHEILADAQGPTGRTPHQLRAAQLPAAVGSFTGRAEHLRALDAALAELGRGEESMVIGVIGGAAGVGKTALAVHWAHRVRAQFPDGQLFVNLFAYGPHPTVRTVDALAHFLRALGVPPEQVPVDADEAAALYRSLLADRRVLVVVDNAATADQVRPLLPGAPTCVVLVTSRVRLSGLVAREAAHPLTLGVLLPEEAEALLRRLIGADRVATEAAAVRTLAGLCAYLPLALRIAAAHLADRPYQRISEYVARLRAGDRLTALTVDGDEQAAVRSAFDLSYEALGADAQLVFRRLGLMPGVDASTAAAAALAGLPIEETARALERLAAVYLVDEHAPDRFTFHDLLRGYAAGRCGTDDDERGRDEAHQRLLDWYRGRVDAASALLYPEITRLVAAQPDALGFGTRAAALDWLDAERANLVAVAVAGGSATAWQLSDALRGYFHLRMCTVDWLTTATAGLAAASAERNPSAQAAAQLSLGDLHWRLSRYPQAITHYGEAAALAAKAGWVRGEAAVLGNLGNVYQQAGMLAEAEERYRRALALAAAPSSEAANLDNLGAVYWEMGRLAAAADHLARAVAILTRSGGVFARAIALSALGEVRHAQGRLAEAGEHLAEALTQHREVGNRGGEAETTRLLGAVARDSGRPDEGLEHALAALTLTRDIGDRRFEADALNTVASLRLVLGDRRQAIADHRAALALAQEIGNRYPEAEALIGLATANLERDTAAAAYALQAISVARRCGYRLLEGRAWAALAAVPGNEHPDAAVRAETILDECGVGVRTVSAYWP